MQPNTSIQRQHRSHSHGYREKARTNETLYCGGIIGMYELKYLTNLSLSCRVKMMWMRQVIMHMRE